MFEAEPGLMIWTIVSFFILLFVLAKFAYRPFLDLLEKREKVIHDAIEESKKTRQAAEDMLEKYKKQMEESQAEARKIIEEARSIGEEAKKDILAKATEESKLILQKTQEEIAREKDRAIAELHEKILDLSIVIASKVIEKAMTQDDQIKLIEESLLEVKGIYGEG